MSGPPPPGSEATGTTRFGAGFWFAAALVVAVVLQWGQVRALGGEWDGLLAIGTDGEATGFALERLPDVTLLEGHGHDGQTVFVVSQAPWGGDEAVDALDHAGFRYRRILLPLLGGGFGTLSASATVYGLALVNALAFAGAAVAMRLIAGRLGLSSWLPVAVIATPGMWLALRITTPDALAMALALGGVAMALANRPWPAALLLAGAGLAKETYILFAVAVAVAAWPTARRRSVLVAAIPLAVLGGWSLFVSVVIGNGITPRGNLAVPPLGIVESLRTLGQASASDRLWWIVTILAVAAAIGALFITRAQWLRILTVPWIVLALVSSTWVWQLGNNAARVLLPLIPLTALMVATRRWTAGQALLSTSRRNLPV